MDKLNFIDRIKYMDRLKALKDIYSACAVFMIILGILLLWKPGMAASTFCRICGVLLILLGIARIAGYFSRDLLQLAFQFDFAMGVVSGLMGIAMVVWPQKLLNVFMITLGLFVLADALLRIQTALDAKRIGVESWWIILVVSILTALLGAILFFEPYGSTRAIVILIGLNLIIDGILNLYVVRSTVSIKKRRPSQE